MSEQYSTPTPLLWGMGKIKSNGKDSHNNAYASQTHQVTLIFSPTHHNRAQPAIFLEAFEDV